MTQPYAEVIGDPVAHSKSPAIHRFWLEKLDIAADYRTCAVAANDLARYFSERRGDPNWRGCNVTMPHKRAVAPFLATVSRAASRIGAINTVYEQNGRLIGENTDGEGFLEPLLPLLERPHFFRMARILGAGGAARAIAAALAEHGFTLVIAARNVDQACELLGAVAPHGQHHAVELAHFADPTDFPFDDRDGCLDVIVNASPLGMRGAPPLAFDWSHAPPGSVAYDIVTVPVDTPFLEAARAAGFARIDGLAMLIGQAAAAFALFFGQPAPREYDAELRALLTA